MAAKPPATLYIRSWPKMVFLWPAMIACLAFGILNLYIPEWKNLWGGIYVVVFTFNMCVLAFDFPRATSLTILIAIVALVLTLVLLNQQLGVITPLQNWIAEQEVYASTKFYMFSFAGMLALFIGMFFITRFDYWELTSNELVHHHGLLGDVERFSTAGLKLNKEISDIFEFILAGSGTIILTVPGTTRPIVLEHVLGITRIEGAADRILNVRTVRVESADASAGTDAAVRAHEEQ